MRTSASNNGFSLIEIVVAVLILSIMTVTLWATLGKSIEVQGESEEIDTRMHEVRMAMDRISRDLSMAFLVNTLTTPSSQVRYKTIFKGSNYTDLDRIDFTAVSHVIVSEEAKEGDTCEISYYTETTNNQTDLLRREDPQIDGEPDSGGKTHVLLEDIVEFNLRYRPLVDTPSVTETWNSDTPGQAQRLPVAVEVEIGFKNHRGQTEILKTLSVIQMREPLDGG